MTYCKHCGMESRNTATCEWCGRTLPRKVHRTQSSKPADASLPTLEATQPPPGATPYTFFIYERAKYGNPSDELLFPVQKAQEDPREVLLDFSIYLGSLLLMGSSLITWHYGNPFILAAIVGMFLAGALMARLNAVPIFEEGLERMGVPLMLMLAVFFPVMLIYVGYVAYGFLTHRSEQTVVRLLTPLFMAVVILLLMSLIAGPKAVPVQMYGQFRGVELLCLSAVLLGWSASSWRRMLSQ